MELVEPVQMNIYQSNTYWKWIPIHESLFYHIVQSNVKPCNGLEFSNNSCPLAKTASHFLHYLLFDQLYAQKCISAVLSQNPIKHPPDIDQMYSVNSIRWPRMESPTEFSQAPLKQGFLTFHYRNSSFCCLPIFFFITTLQTSPKQYTRFQ